MLGCKGKPFAVLTVKVDVDLLQWALFVVSFLVRAYCLHYPSEVIFDEQVLGTFASYYLRRSFFLDGSPPLSAQFAAMPALLAGHDGSFFNFTRIGTEYPVGVPFVAMRYASCFVGSLLIPLAYGVLVELHVDRCLAAAGALALAAEPSLVLQSRVIMPESLLLTCCFACLYCLLRARRHLTTAAAATLAGPGSGGIGGSLTGVLWLLLCGIFGGLAVSTRFIGFFTLLLVTVVALADYWSALANLRLSAPHLLCRLASIATCVLVVPAAVYISVWWIHVTMLTRALPHTTYRLSSPFVASLEGGISLITGGQPKEVAFGSVLTLRHARGTSCWLHSHRDLYPLSYADGRGSSYQQQVTCYPFKDRNNWWIVKPAAADGDEDDSRVPLHVDTPPQLVRHGDIIELLHGSTLRKLNSHNVAAPLSIDHQEVSGYIDYNVSMPPHTEWRVDIVNRLTDDDVWRALFSEVRLIHVHSSQALSISGLVLPEWGSFQYEVVTEKYHEVPATVWSVEEHKYLSDPAASGDVTRQVGRAELLPTTSSSSSYGFWSKLMEIHTKLFAEATTARRSGLAGSHDHRFRSTPITWPLGLANIVYWVHNSSNVQIHLIANPVVWWPAASAILMMSIAHAIIAVKRQVSSREKTDHAATTSAGSGRQLDDEGESGAALHFRRLLLVGGYAAHYAPFFLTDDVLFLYCYLPSLVYAILALVASADSLTRCFPGCRSWLLAASVVWVACVVAVSLRLSPLVYGSAELSPDEWRLFEKTLGWDYIERR